MHGELSKVKCNACGHTVPWEGDLSTEDVCEACNTPALLRPAIVWFGEMPLEMDRIMAALTDCDLFMSIGTSGNVYPAAGFVQEARMNGKAHTVELNLEPSEGASLFHDSVTARRPKWCRNTSTKFCAMAGLNSLLKDIRACRICEQHLPLGPNPVIRASKSAKILSSAKRRGRRFIIRGFPGTMHRETACVIGCRSIGRRFTMKAASP